MRDASEQDLVARLGTDPAAFEEFYRRHVDAVTRLAVRRVGQPDQAADLVAEVFLAVIESADRYEPDRGEPIAWVMGVAVNRAAAAGCRRLRRAGGPDPASRPRSWPTSGPEPVRVGQGGVAAADVLREVAAVTERQPATKPGVVRYARMLERRLVVGRLGGTTWVGHVRATVESWTRRSDGAYRERRSEIELTFPTGRDRANHQRWVAAGSPNHHDIPANHWPEVAGLRPSDRTEGPGHVVPVTDTVLGLKLADLPTNPAALAKIIRISQAGRRFADNTQDAPIEHKMWAWLCAGPARRRRPDRPGR
jgi:DNA-directed RNA polymerase specialized sigma24 family protein